MLITELIAILERAKDRLGDVPVKGWDSRGGNIETFDINVVNSEGTHIELTD